MPLVFFFEGHGKWIRKAVTHQHLKKLQQQHIAAVSACVDAEQLCLLLRCNFAKIMRQKIQGYHYSNDQGLQEFCNYK